MKPFMALVLVLYRKLGLDREPRQTTGAAGRIRWELDLNRWAPEQPNQRQDPKTWTCMIELPAGRGFVHAEGRDGAEALTGAIAELVKREGNDPEVRW